jgi:hypothetical protein
MKLPSSAVSDPAVVGEPCCWPGCKERGDHQFYVGDPLTGPAVFYDPAKWMCPEHFFEVQTYEQLEWRHNELTAIAKIRQAERRAILEKLFP